MLEIKVKLHKNLFNFSDFSLIVLSSRITQMKQYKYHFLTEVISRHTTCDKRLQVEVALFYGAKRLHFPDI